MGLEIISQPQLFLRPLTALNGVEGYVPPYFATFHTCMTSSPVSSYTFPLTGQLGLHITNSSDSYIVNIDGVVQPPPSYSVDANTRIITFVKPIPPNTEIFITQIGTTVSMVSVASLTADKTYLRNAIAENLVVTSLTALSAEIRIVDITQYELSGYTIRGNTDVIGNFNVSQLISATNLEIVEKTTSKTLSVTNGFITNLSADKLSADSVFINVLSANNNFITKLTALTADFNVIGSNVNVNGNIAGTVNNLKASFNQGTAIGDYSFAVNSGVATGNYSHAEGYSTNANDVYNHVEGYVTQASGIASHAEGYSTKAIGDYSHAEGYFTEATGTASHAEGDLTRATGLASHAAGRYAIAAHNLSWIWNGSSSGPSLSTTKSGQFMVSAEGGVFLPGAVGIGTDSQANALTVVGNISATGNIVSPNQTIDSNSSVLTRTLGDTRYGNIVYAVLEVNSATNNTTTYSTITSIPLEANSIYEIDSMIQITTSNNGGTKFRLQYSGTQVFVNFVETYYSSAATTTFSKVVANFTETTQTSDSVRSHIYRRSGIIKTLTAGTLSAQMALNSSSGNVLGAYGSYILARKLV